MTTGIHCEYGPTCHRLCEHYYIDRNHRGTPRCYVHRIVKIAEVAYYNSRFIEITLDEYLVAQVQEL
jgi:hypothetical protein